MLNINKSMIAAAILSLMIGIYGNGSADISDSEETTHINDRPYSNITKEEISEDLICIWSGNAVVPLHEYDEDNSNITEGQKLGNSFTLGKGSDTIYVIINDLPDELPTANLVLIDEITEKVLCWFPNCVEGEGFRATVTGIENHTFKIITHTEENQSAEASFCIYSN